ncbi:MAG: EAL domain-containing protein [Phyllobacteriaceae bacterium]|nr:EAL domain-containing protein [Phyllobacteriaceae bacterium]
MQALVYSLIGLASASLGFLAYFALTFTPANAILVSLVALCLAIVFMERKLRERAENRLERAIEELSRLLSTDAQAGAVLGQRINALTDLNSGQRLETVEADISVLGTVIRQVAEAVADIEDKVAKTAPRPAPVTAERVITAAPPRAPTVTSEPEPIIPLEVLRQSIAENRLVCHVQPIVRLPQRRAAAYDLHPRLMLEDGDLADTPDFMPRRGGQDLVRHIEGVALLEAVAIARRSRTGGQPVMLHIPLSRATLANDGAVEQLLASLDANRAIASGLTFLVEESEWLSMTTRDRAVIDQMVRKGAGFSLAGVTSLRVDIAELADQGVRSLRVDARAFIAAPESFTDFHMSDIADYLARFEVSPMATGIENERQIVELLDNGIVLVKGNHIAAPGPVRADLALDSMRNAAPRPRRAEM